MSQSLSDLPLQAYRSTSLELPECTPTSRLLPRRHLVALLLERPVRLRLLCAPVGYGKSALLKQCMAQTETVQRTLRLNLAGQPLSLERFCKRIAEQLGYLPDRMDNGPALLDFLEGLDEPFSLILDDYPVRAETALDAWIDHLLLHSSARVELWVSCRQRPTWNLPRLLLDGELLELDSRLLGFTRQESDDLVTLLTPTAANHESIWQQTLGWCAGVRLLLSVHVQDARGAALLLRDYLEHELLSTLSTDECRLLQDLACLPRFCASLCAQLWEELDDRTALDKLLRSQVLFQSLDNEGRWYRLLPAVAQALQGILASSELNRLRLCACRELNASGYIEDAIDLALSAGHPEVAVNYMASLEPSWLLAGRNLQRLQEWRKRLPGKLHDVTPQLVVLMTSALLMSARLDEAQACLAQLRRFLPQPDAVGNHRLLTVWQALQGTLYGLLGNGSLAREYCQNALVHLGKDERYVSFLCTAVLARLAMSTGETVQAQQTLMVAIEQARRQGSVIREVQINIHRTCLMILCAESELAARLLQESFALLQVDGNHHPMLLGGLLVMKGKLHLQRGELELCEQVLRQALALDTPSYLTVLQALTELSEVFACRGDFQRASACLQDAERRMHCENVQESSYRAVINLQTLSVLIHQENWAQALSMAHMTEQYLRGSAARSSSLQVPSLPVHSQFLLALVEQGVGRIDDAEKRLRTALRECQRLNFHGLQAKLQSTLDNLGRHPGQTTRRTPPTHVAGTFNLLVSEARRGPANSSIPQVKTGAGVKKHESLSCREISVLELLAEGLSNREISERLYISTNTVKAHIKHINSKLGVTRRAQAVMRAKTIGVLI